MRAIVFAAAAALAVPAAPAWAEDGYLDAGTSTATVQAPLPGGSVKFDVTARPKRPSRVTLALRAASLPNGDTAPVELRLEAGGQLLASGTAASLLGKALPLGVLDEQPVTVEGTLSVPRTAGNELNGADIDLVFRLAANLEPGTPVAPTPGPPPTPVPPGSVPPPAVRPTLPPKVDTGGDIAPAWLAPAVVLGGCGLLALTAAAHLSRRGERR